MEAHYQRGAQAKPKHPQLPELLGGLNLGANALRSRSDAAQLTTLIELLANAEYWLSFDLAGFEALLARSPSPLRELAVGIALRYGEGIDGSVQASDVASARTVLLSSIPADLESGLVRGLDTLDRSIAARDRRADFAAEGFEEYTPTAALSIHALMAMGRARIEVSGARSGLGGGTFEVELGVPLDLSSSDDRGKALDPPEIESELGAPLIVRRPEGSPARRVVFLVPGRYRLRVPNRSEGARWLIAR